MTVPTPFETVSLPVREKARAADVLARAFSDDALYVDLFPDAARRLDVLRAMFGAVVGHALTFGEVTTTPGVEGAACWLAPGKTDLTLWRVMRTGFGLMGTGFGLMRAMVTLRRDARRRFLKGESHVGRMHKRLIRSPHWYLLALGVMPEAQGRGIGGGLLRPVLARADAERLPCYLETQTEDNVRFYERRGFDVVEAGELPGQRVSVPMWYMIRVPRT